MWNVNQWLTEDIKDKYDFNKGNINNKIADMDLQVTNELNKNFVTTQFLNRKKNIINLG